MAASIIKSIALDLGVDPKQVAAAVALIDGGSTVPFIARYRKEATGSLDDAQLRRLDERLAYLRDLEERRTTVLRSVREQGRLDPTLEAAILAADSKGRLEDIYLPFRPKRRTRAETAREAGLEPLSDLLLSRPDLAPERRRFGSSNPIEASPTPRPPSTAPAPSWWNASAKMPTSSAPCARPSGGAAG